MQNKIWLRGWLKDWSSLIVIKKPSTQNLRAIKCMNKECFPSSLHTYYILLEYLRIHTMAVAHSTQMTPLTIFREISECPMKDLHSATQISIHRCCACCETTRQYTMLTMTSFVNKQTTRRFKYISDVNWTSRLRPWNEIETGTSFEDDRDNLRDLNHTIVTHFRDADYKEDSVRIFASQTKSCDTSLVRS